MYGTGDVLRHLRRECRRLVTNIARSYSAARKHWPATRITSNLSSSSKNWARDRRVHAKARQQASCASERFARGRSAVQHGLRSSTFRLTSSSTKKVRWWQANNVAAPIMRLSLPPARLSEIYIAAQRIFAKELGTDTVRKRLSTGGKVILRHRRQPDPELNRYLSDVFNVDSDWTLERFDQGRRHCQTRTNVAAKLRVCANSLLGVPMSPSSEMPRSYISQSEEDQEICQPSVRGSGLAQSIPTTLRGGMKPQGTRTQEGTCPRHPWHACRS